MLEIKEQLLELQDKSYQVFQQKLVPNINKDTIIGVRMPMLRTFAKGIKSSGIDEKFLQQLPHQYYEENMLHSILLCNIQNIEKCLKQIDIFVPYIDNWAVCDAINPKLFNKNPQKVLKYVKKWIKNPYPYSQRVAIITLMNYFLKENFDTKYLEMVKNVKSENYYVNMARAWYFAEALVHRYDDAVKIIEEKSMDKFTQNKSIQKANESFRLEIETKRYLKSLKIK